MENAMKIKRIKYANSLWVIILPLTVFILLGVIVAVERAGIMLNDKEQPLSLALLPPGKIIPRNMHNNDVNCLVIYNSVEENTPASVPNIRFVLDQMSVGYTLLDVGKDFEFPSLDKYKTMIFACAEMTPIFIYFDKVVDWIYAGGGLLFAMTPEDDTIVNLFNRLLGVERGSYDFIPQIDAKLVSDLLPGGNGTTVPWSDPGSPVEDYRLGLNFNLDETCNVHLVSSGPQGPTPLLWDHKVGNGRVVVNNNDAVYERWSRGFFAAAYSLTEPAMAWPVINSSVIFIDDFPSPVPEGYNQYVRKDYGLMTEYFYVHIWFPDMLRLAKQYKLKYTGLFVETYNDNVEPPFNPEPAYINERMKYFGTLLLNEGFEIGMHGYDHQSLVLPNFDYRDELDYNKWPNTEDMKESLDELVRFDKEMFPNHPMTTYVPPSNVLSKEGRAMIKQNFPEINMISGLQVDDLFGLEDEFGVAPDGLINFPRLTSGCYPFDDPDDVTAKWAMMCELNLHFVHSHFVHPDDMLDPDRGATRGWRSMVKSFEEYLAWLTQFPIRQMTAREAGPAVQRWDSLTVHTTSLTDKEMVLDLDAFYDEAWLMIRVNDSIPTTVVGGSLTKITNSLYLLKANAAHITISLEPKAAS